LNWLKIGTRRAARRRCPAHALWCCAQGRGAAACDARLVRYARGVQSAQQGAARASRFSERQTRANFPPDFFLKKIKIRTYSPTHFPSYSRPGNKKREGLVLWRGLCPSERCLATRTGAHSSCCSSFLRTRQPHEPGSQVINSPLRSIPQHTICTCLCATNAAASARSLV
jgi:hypothetical protein